MENTVFELNELPPRLVEAITSGNSELSIVDHEMTVARVVPCLRGQARIPGLHPGAFDVAADFDTPLPDEFWLGGQ